MDLLFVSRMAFKGCLTQKRDQAKVNKPLAVRTPQHGCGGRPRLSRFRFQDFSGGFGAYVRLELARF